jgi:hypothetical protein
MENKNNFMKYPIAIKFSGTVMDFDEHLCNCEWDVPANLNERVTDLLSRFFKISGIKEGDNKFYFNDESIEKYKSYYLFNLNLSNNANIQIAYIDKDSHNIGNNTLNIFANGNDNNILKNNAIYIKFIKLNNNQAYNSNKELKGILKLCILKEFADKINLPDIGIWKLGGLPEIVYFILKILKYGYNYQYDYDNPSPNIKELLQKEKGCNIINFSNFVDEEFKISTLQNIMKTIYVNNINDMNDSYCRLGKYELYMSSFEKDIIRALKHSVFEFSIVSLVILDSENFDKFEEERAKCPNRCTQLLYHGTQIHPASSLLNELLKKTENYNYQRGKGLYLTDSLDTCWFYGGPRGSRINIDKIPGIGDTFTSIVNMVYFNKNKFMLVNDHQTRLQPGKNEVNFAYVSSNLETIENPDSKKFFGTEYVIWDLDQICPFISVKFKRDEFCVIWRDDNFNEKAVYNDEYDAIFKHFLKERMKYIRQSAKFNVYPCSTTDEALKLVNRKKYNKIILISNVRPDKEGKKFIEQARQIIGNDVIALFFAYSIQHLDWIKNYKNALFSNNIKFYEEYLDNFDSESKMRELISKLENYYKVKFNFDDNFLNFPLFKEEGNYSDLSF